MHITLLTYGSRGDVEPFVSLGRGFLEAGHNVRLVAPGIFASLAVSRGIDFVGLPGDPERLVRELVDMAGKNWWRMVMVMSRFVVPLAGDVSGQVRAACAGTDVVVHSFLMTQAGHETALELGIPDVSAQFFPVFNATAEFAGVVFPDLPLGDLYKRFTHGLVTQTYWQGGRLLYWWVRRANPHLPPLSGWPFSRRNEQRPPILYAFSPHIVPPPRDWPDDAHVTGYWFLDDPGDWQAPRGLLSFLEDGPPPVAIGLGSTVTRRPNELAQAVLQALTLSGQRGVIVGRGLRTADLPGDIFALEHAPYDWLFPRTSAVAHHGGAGTTGAGLRAGVPNIVVPFTSDQPFWARRVHALGAGPEPIPARKLSADRLAAAIVEAVNDADMRRRAREIGERLRAEDGVRKAVQLVQAHVESVTI